MRGITGFFTSKYLINRIVGNWLSDSFEPGLSSMRIDRLVEYNSFILDLTEE